MQTFLLLLVCPLALANRYIRQPYANDTFSAPVKFGQNQTLKCEDEFLRNPSLIEYWILPNNLVMKKGENLTTYPHPVDGIGAWKVSNNASEIYIYNVMEYHFGIYICMAKDAKDELYAIKKGLNYNGPYFGDLWQVYRVNTMVGGIAAAIFVVIVTILYVVYVVRFKKEDLTENSPVFENAFEEHPVPPTAASLNDVHVGSSNVGHMNRAFDNQEASPYLRAASPKVVEDNTQL